MKRFTLLFMVLAAGLFAQEAMEATEEMAPADSMGMEDMMMPEEAPMEETMMEEAGESVETMLAEEGTMETEPTGSPLAGYYIGLKGGYPIFIPESGAAGNGEAALVFGGSVTTPFGFMIGPMGIYPGLSVELYDFDEGNVFNGIIALATLNAAIVETPFGDVGAQVGAGLVGNSVGGIVAANFGYSIPNVPVIVKPAARLTVGLEPGAADTGLMYWLNVGLGLEVDLGGF